MAATEKYFSVFQSASNEYEKDHPHWRIEVLVSLIKWGLTNLRHFVEDPQSGDITWENSFIELHYPVDWNWGARGDTLCSRHIFGEITKKNTKNRKIAAKTLSEIMVRRWNAVALADATNWVWYKKLNDQYTLVVPVEISEELSAIRNGRARLAEVDELIRPFSVGAPFIDYGDMEFRDGEKVPKRVAKQLANSNALLDIPRIEISTEVSGRKIDMSVIFQIDPLIADYDEKKAYHPIAVGLFIAPEILGEEVVTRTPSDWPKKDQKALWDELLRDIGKVTDKLIPKTESQDSIILLVNSKIKVPAECWLPENRSSTIKEIADINSLAGELAGIKVESAESGAERPNTATCPVCGWIHDPGFTQIAINSTPISLGGVLPEIVRLVHDAHKKGLNALSTKDEALIKACGGYRHPCKAFDDLNQSSVYKLLFDTRRRGFISLRGAVGRNRNKSESNPE